MRTKFFVITAAAGLCLIPGLRLPGLMFAAACLFVPGIAEKGGGWPSVIIGALSCDIIAMLSGEGKLLFWGLTVCAVVGLSLISLPKAALLALAAYALLRFEAGAAVYVSLFIGVIWNVILLFTYEKKYDIIKPKLYYK